MKAMMVLSQREKTRFVSFKVPLTQLKYSRSHADLMRHLMSEKKTEVESFSTFIALWIIFYFYFIFPS